MQFKCILFDFRRTQIKGEHFMIKQLVFRDEKLKPRHFFRHSQKHLMIEWRFICCPHLFPN